MAIQESQIRVEAYPREIPEAAVREEAVSPAESQRQAQGAAVLLAAFQRQGEVVAQYCQGAALPLAASQNQLPL